MKTILFRILKWGGIVLAVIIILPIIAGLVMKMTAPDFEPNGEMVDIGGFSLNLDCKGQANDRPTVIIESGSGTPSQQYHWIQQGLMDITRVCRYDRAGLGFSDASDTSRDADTVAAELHTLLRKAGEKPPYIMAGHSLGGPYIRVYADNYPGEAVGLVFLDSSHPQQVERLDLPDDIVNPALFKMIAVAADLGLANILSSFIPTDPENGLPASEIAVSDSFMQSGKGIRAGLKEIDALDEIFARAGETGDFGDIPVRVFTAGAQPEELLQSYGVDVEKMKADWLEMQIEMAEISGNGFQTTIEGASHMSINNTKKYADITVAEMRRMVLDY